MWFRPAPITPPPRPRPRVLWIELTSKCPFDCVFCSRRLRRGGGLHMDMALYRAILADLDAPELIRLNYSGESTHHPAIIEAIRLAAATGAETELVTALASLPERLVAPLARSGLSRLTLSLHTMDPLQFGEIYRHGSLADVRARVAALRAAGDGPALDLAVVAMRRNLDQLPAIADFAEEAGAAALSIHPVIRRDAIAESFAEELDGERLRPGFLAALNATVTALRATHPDLTITVSTPEAEGGATCLGPVPVPFPGPLPPGARIHGCEQNPWDTVHILADGSVVTCEVRDRTVLGQLTPDGAHHLGEVWQGAAYRAFRARYVEGGIPECRQCPYKLAYRPTPLAAEIAAAGGPHAQLRHGWHPPDIEGPLWARRHAVLTLARPVGARRLTVSGVVPGGAGPVAVWIEGHVVGALGSGGTEAEWLTAEFPLPRTGGALSVELHAAGTMVPARCGQGEDRRELGFGLTRIAAA
jgi:MoaA/NifB/PqqE/SkfB family radical SAM enzyme